MATITNSHPNSLPNAVDREAIAGPIVDVFTGLLNRIRRANEARRARAVLATMDAALLRDIGIGEDEIARIRARETFTPRAFGPNFRF